MRISHRHKFLFLSKPRSGSTSVRTMLAKHSDVICNHKDQPEPGFHPHLNWRATLNLFESQGWDYSSYFSFTTLRNPWELAVSYYSFFKPDFKGRYNFVPNHDPDQPMAFKTWLFEGKTWDIGNRVWRKDIGAPGIGAFAFDENSSQRVDAIYPIERMDELATALSERIGARIKSKHINRSVRDADYRSHFDPESVDRVAKIFAKDIELGHYQF